jgi:hypothetical protein
MLSIRTRHFATEPWSRKNFAWIAQPLGIERIAYRLHYVETVL